MSDKIFPKSLAQGLVPATELVIYTCPLNKRVTITLMDFANTSLSAATLNIYKNVRTTVGSARVRISPVDFTFNSKFLAQEDGTITLEAGNEIVAICSEADVVEYHLNGVESEI